MRKLRLSTISLGKFRRQIQDSCQIYLDTDIGDGVWDRNINNGIYFLSEVLGWIDLPDYRDNSIVPITASVFCSALTGSAFDSLLSQLTVPATAYWLGATGFDSSWIGATGTIQDTTGGGHSYQVTILTIIDAQNVIISTNPVPSGNIAAAKLIVNISNLGSLNAADDIDLTTYTFFKQISKIEKVTYTVGGIGGQQLNIGGGGGQTVQEKLATGGSDENGRMKITTTVFQKIKSDIQNGMSIGQVVSNYPDSVLWLFSGETLNMIRGENVTSYGTRRIYVVLNPAYCTNDTDLLDIRDVNLPVLERYVRITTLLPVARQAEASNLSG